MADRRCAATNREGEACAMAPLQGSAYCWAHDASRGAERAKARREGGRRRQTPTLHPAGDAPPSLRTVPHIVAELENVYHDTMAQVNGAPRSRALASLLMLGLRALEIGEHEERLAAVEAQLKQRGPRRMA